MNLHLKRTAEYRISNRRMSKGGIALLSLLNKIDRIHYFDIRHSLFDIRYSLFRSFLFDQTGFLLAGLRRAQPNRGHARVKLHEITNSECT
ncbi:hypothetical protein D1AOALGA4SA_8263 [Olavius algarvensis Delta 1 endosymbiont]|nr:hypothetical protein D1AOALGA4SA_8263 [Olavius algarvensis Delta 1 endosymbiont]